VPRLARTNWTGGALSVVRALAVVEVVDKTSTAAMTIANEIFTRPLLKRVARKA
jgi:hypothetical protein